MTDAELRSLLVDSLKLWEVSGKVIATDETVSIETDQGAYSVTRASPDLLPVRWFYQTPERRAANRPPRAAPSIVALLSALRNAMNGSGGQMLRVGGG
jgi:hypothetical protein